MGVQLKTSKRKQYTAEFKHEAVRPVSEGGLSMAQVARELGLDDNLVSRWKKEAQLEWATRVSRSRAPSG